jgi:hypothetical protein
VCFIPPTCRCTESSPPLLVPNARTPHTYPTYSSKDKQLFKNTAIGGGLLTVANLTWQANLGSNGPVSHQPSRVCTGHLFSLLYNTIQSKSEQLILVGDGLFQRNQPL